MMLAILNHLWQSTGCTLLAGGLVLMLRNSRASLRYGLWFAASLKFLVPFGLLMSLGARWAPHTALATLSVSALPLLADDGQRVMAPFVASAAPVPAAFPWQATALGFWALGAAGMIVSWSRRCIQLRALVRAAIPLPLSAPVAIRATAAPIEPGLVGIVRPVLLLPEQLIRKLSEPAIRMIVAHELCHFRRRDNLTFAVHMLVQTLFWFYPLTWWLGRRLVSERESACDEAVVASGHDAHAYGQSLLQVCRFRFETPSFLAASVTGADLKRRIYRIMTLRGTRPLRKVQRMVLAATALVTVLSPLTLGLLAVHQAVAPASARVPTPAQIARALKEQTRPRSAVRFNPLHFAPFVGYYEIMPGVFFHVFRTGAHYFVQTNTQQALEIFPESPTQFFTAPLPSQLSFVADARGRITGLILHHDGVLQAVQRVDEQTAAASQAVLQARIKQNLPGPGTEASLRRWLQSEERGHVNYRDMTPTLAALAQPRDPAIQVRLRQLGPLQSLTFEGVTPVGMDIYRASFVHGTRDLFMAPLTREGKAEMILWRTPP